MSISENNGVSVQFEIKEIKFYCSKSHAFNTRYTRLVKYCYLFIKKVLTRLYD